jgi:hypothetical protein
MGFDHQIAENKHSLHEAPGGFSWSPQKVLTEAQKFVCGMMLGPAGDAGARQLFRRHHPEFYLRRESDGRIYQYVPRMRGCRERCGPCAVCPATNLSSLMLATVGGYASPT